MRYLILFRGVLGLLLLSISAAAFAAIAVIKDGVTTIHLDEYNGYFAAKETLVDLEPGLTRKTHLKLMDNGIFYRCPVSPTPCYEVAAK